MTKKDVTLIAEVIKELKSNHISFSNKHIDIITDAFVYKLIEKNVGKFNPIKFRQFIDLVKEVK